MTNLYLVWLGQTPPGPIAWDGDVHRLNDHLWMVRSDLTRSKLYHRTKWQLPEGTALLVAPLEDEPDAWPKFKNMEAGALAWLRGSGR